MFDTVAVVRNGPRIASGDGKGWRNLRCCDCMREVRSKRKAAEVFGMCMAAVTQMQLQIHGGAGAGRGERHAPATPGTSSHFPSYLSASIYRLAKRQVRVEL